MSMEPLGNFALGTITTFISSKATGYVLVILSKHEKVREIERMTVVAIFSVMAGLIIGVLQHTTATSRHRRKIIKKSKRV